MIMQTLKHYNVMLPRYTQLWIVTYHIQSLGRFTASGTSPGVRRWPRPATGQPAAAGIGG